LTYKNSTILVTYEIWGPLIFKTLILISGLLFFNTCYSQSNLEGEVVVEGEKQRKKTKKQLKIPTGKGAKELEGPENEFDIELSKMSGENELSAKRPYSSKILRRRKKKQIIQRVELSDYTLVETDYSDNKSDIVLGHLEDEKKEKFLNNNGTPLTRGDDYKDELQNDASHTYLSTSHRLKKAKLNIEVDKRDELIYAGKLARGELSSHGAQLNTNFHFKKNLDATAFIFASEDNFSPNEDAFIDPTIKVKSTNVRPGASVRYEEEALKGQLAISTESYKRREGTKVSRFQRTPLKARIEGKLKNPWVYNEALITGHLIEDKTLTTKEQKDIYNIYNAAILISSPLRYSYGLDLKAKRYSLAPTPQMKFGDGRLIRANPDLGVEKGVRAAIGPWYEGSFLSLKLSYFRDQSKESPVWVGGPGGAKAIAIDGIWSEGIITSARFDYEWLTFSTSYLNQETLNDSETNIFRGKRVPGRPQSTWKTELEVSYNEFSSGLSYEYDAKIPLNSNNTLFQESSKTFGAYVQYKKKTYALKLEGENLFANENQALEFEEASGSNILEPNIKTQRYVLKAEISL
jgi:hypothetical protein